MAERPRALSLTRIGDDSLVGWALASFHTATLTVVPLAGLYLAGAVGDLLAGLETSIGLGLYLALWTTTWWATRNVLRELADRAGDEGEEEVADGGEGADDREQQETDDGRGGDAGENPEGADDASTLSVALVGMKWGGANGVAFFWVLLAGFAALNLPRELGRALGAAPFLLIAGFVGSILALGIGGIVGVLFTSLDIALFRVAARIASESSVRGSSE